MDVAVPTRRVSLMYETEIRRNLTSEVSEFLGEPPITRMKRMRTNQKT